MGRRMGGWGWRCRPRRAGRAEQGNKGTKEQRERPSPASITPMESEPKTLAYARTSVRSPFSWWTAGGCALAGAGLGPGALLLTETVGGVGAIAAGFVAMLIGIGLGSRNPALRDLFQYAGVLGLAGAIPAVVIARLHILRETGWSRSQGKS